MRDGRRRSVCLRVLQWRDQGTHRITSLPSTPFCSYKLVLTCVCFSLGVDYRTDDRIAQMEAKLQQLAQAPPTGTEPPDPAHPSLPAKPGAHPQSASNAPVKAAPTTVPTPRTKPPLPLVSRVPSPPPPVTSSAVRAVPSRKSNAGLKGVKFVRKKDKTKVEGTGEGSS
jgi:hypothetical protein